MAIYSFARLGEEFLDALTPAIFIFIFSELYYISVRIITQFPHFQNIYTDISFDHNMKMKFRFLSLLSINLIYIPVRMYPSGNLSEFYLTIAISNAIIVVFIFISTLRISFVGRIIMKSGETRKAFAIVYLFLASCLYFFLISWVYQPVYLFEIYLYEKNKIAYYLSG